MKRWKNWTGRRPVMAAALWAAAFGAVVSLSACGGKAAGTVSMMETTAAYGESGAADYEAKGGMAALNAMPLEREDIVSGETAAGAGESGLSDTSEISGIADTGRKLIRDVDMNVEAEDFDGVLSRITSGIKDMGGYIESSNVSGISVNSRGDSQQRHAQIKARIPAHKLDGFVKTVEEAGNVTSRQEQVTDVTLQYSDVESRKKSLEIEQERLWALLEKADSLDAVVTLESRLSDIRYQLESYTSQLRLYDNQVTYSTVSIYMEEVKDVTLLTPAVPDSVGTRIQKGFTRSLNSLEEAGIELIVWFASNSPMLLVLAVVIAAAALVVRRVGRKARRGSRQDHPGDYGKNRSDNRFQGEDKAQGGDKAQGEDKAQE